MGITEAICNEKHWVNSSRKCPVLIHILDIYCVNGIVKIQQDNELGALYLR